MVVMTPSAQIDSELLPSYKEAQHINQNSQVLLTVYCRKRDPRFTAALSFISVPNFYRCAQLNWFATATVLLHSSPVTY